MNVYEIKWTNIPFLEGLNNAEIEQVISAGKLLKLQTGEYVFHAGDEGNEMFVVISGSVRVETIVGGSRQILARFKKGQIFGEIAFVTKILRTADIIAEEKLEVFEISEAFLHNLTATLPETAAKILFNLSRILCERLANTTRSWIDSEYENILILFQTLATETETKAVFNKFVDALVKALPRVGAVEFITEGRNFLWSRSGFNTFRPSLDFLEKHHEVFTDEEHFRTICPVQIEGRITSYLILSQDPGALLSNKELDLLIKVSTQLGLVIDRILLYEETKAMATTDPLTGLFNRNIFNKELAKEIMRSRRFGTSLSMLIGDLDHFKKINDTYGHLAGDETLRMVASLISKTVRNSDIACRYGGEEFVVVLPMTDSLGADIIAERIRKDVEELKIKFNDLEIRITISIGVATYKGAAEPEEFFKRVDDAVYESKTKGRNMVSTAR